MKKIKILICDSQTLFRAGIIQTLKNEPDLFIIGEAENGNDLIAKYELLKPNLVITDISLPGLSGIDAVKQLKMKYPGIKTIFISMFQGEFYIYYALKVGAFGLLSKSIIKGELLYAINEVLDGRYYFGPQYDDKKLQKIIKKYHNDPIGLILNSSKDPTEIEIKILKFISEGLSSIEIAEKLSVGVRRIDYLRVSIMRKYKLENTFALIRFAVLYTESIVPT